MPTTSDPSDPRLSHGPDEEPTEQAEVYLVADEQQRAAAFVRPLRLSYVHLLCGTVTRMARPIAETYAINPYFYGSTWCAQCRMHRPVGPGGEFVWDDGTGEMVGE